MNGQGIYKLKNGDTYSGQLEDGYFHGQGAYRCANGESYFGEFQNGLRSGQGIIQENQKSCCVVYRNGVLE